MPARCTMRMGNGGSDQPSLAIGSTVLLRQWNLKSPFKPEIVLFFFFLFFVFGAAAVEQI